DDDTRMALDQPREHAGDPCLHLDERLTPGEAEAARVALHDLPLGLSTESPQRPACPGTDIEFGELPLDADGAAARLRDHRRGLAGALERRGVNRLDLRVRGEPPRDGRGLAAPGVGEVQTRRPTREDGPRRPSERVADEQDQRRRLHRAPFTASSSHGLIAGASQPLPGASTSNVTRARYGGSLSTISLSLRAARWASTVGGRRSESFNAVFGRSTLPPSVGRGSPAAPVI